KAEELALEIEDFAGETLQHGRERLFIELGFLIRIDPEIAGFDRRDAAADAELEASPAHLIEHANLFDQVERMMDGQGVDKRAEAQLPSALRERRHEDARRRGDAQRRAVVLGHVVAVIPAAIIGLGEGEALLVKCLERQRTAIEMIEDSKFHGLTPEAQARRPIAILARSGGGRNRGRAPIRRAAAPP